MPVFYRSAGEPAQPATVYLHGVPTSSDDWVPFLERTGGLAPDLIGFGRTSKAGNLDYSIQGLTNFLEQFLAARGTSRLQLVMHDWGAAPGLGFALAHPERVERLVLINALPLLEGFRWPRFARLWRRRLLGELAMGSTTHWLLGRALRSGSATPGAWSRERLDQVWQQFDQGTQRAILRLYRSTDEARLARAGDGLVELHVPALVLWGELDPWLAASLGEAYRSRLPQARLERIAHAGHWPWLDQPDLIDRVAQFLA